MVTKLTDKQIDLAKQIDGAFDGAWQNHSIDPAK